ncbi:PEGA domain-containing protein [Paraliomyxa miuraensis]|uniref:PEGA domain-containing protein n=1 Tax=Paraliomyxa miuraensis TaxID=376150 RepID=UPI0022593B60|nr:PEGA domain-containing protein [Paraliomyxa miuraensis]MCX4245492.1 PEGA domain-containing protein [Paraliomyxa miuraensis]
MSVGSLPAAAEGPGVLISPPTIEGQAPEHIVEALTQSIQGGLSDAGVTAAVPPEGCTDSGCMAQAVADGKARAYVTTDVRIVGSDYTLVVDILASDGQSLGRKEGSCEICTYEEAGVALRELVAQAAADLGPPPTVAGTLVVTSVPAGATVRIDGAEVGVTPYEGSVDAGPHKVELSLDGHQTAWRSVELAGGATQTVELALDRTAAGMSPKTTATIGWAAIGVGAAALVGGIALLVLDENPVRSNCDGVHVDADGDCEFRYDTLGGGIGLTVAGVASAGTGVGLLLYSRKQQQQRGPGDVALVPGGLRVRF